MPEIIDQHSFDEIDELMTEITAHNPSGSLHGFLSGQISAGVVMDDGQWLAAICEFMDVDMDPLQPLVAQELIEFCTAISQQLADTNSSYYPLLPIDSESLAMRIQVLSDWSDGYLAGFGMAESLNLKHKSLGQDSLKQDSLDIINDALRDIAALAGIRFDEAQELAEEGEEDYMQVVEYARTAVMSIYLEFNTTSSPARPLQDSESNPTLLDESNGFVGQLFSHKLH